MGRIKNCIRLEGSNLEDYILHFLWKSLDYYFGGGVSGILVTMVVAITLGEFHCKQTTF